MKQQTFHMSVGTEQIVVYAVTGTCAARSFWDCERHNNGDCEMHVVLEGECRVGLDEGEYVMQAGDAILIPSGRYHCATTLPGIFSRFFVSFGINDTSSWLLHDCRQFRASEQMLRLCRAIHSEIDLDDDMSLQMISAYYTQLFILIRRMFFTHTRSNGTLHPAVTTWRTSIIDDFFENHRDSYGAKEALATELHLSLRQLDRVLLDIYGMNFRQKMLQARMDYAAWLLRTEEKTITEIQSLVGYTSATSFFKAFEKVYSMTPKQYRTMLRSR